MIKRLYKRSMEPFLDEELFRNPVKEYRGAPFWAWNCKVTKEDTVRTLDALKKMGMGGVHIHSRRGMDIPYLSDEFMEMVSFAHAYADQKDMLTWLYDEDKWPSGFGGGRVTEKEENRIRFLVFSPVPLLGVEAVNERSADAGQAIRSENRRFLARYRILLKDGYLQSFEMLNPQEETAEDENIWYAYLEISGDNPWYNNQSYVDTLNSGAIRDFLNLTHERYAQVLGEDFGTTIPSIFTDEPQFCHKRRLTFAEEKAEGLIPYTDAFEELYQKKYGKSFLAGLPEIFWDLPEGKYSENRYFYHDFLCELFVNSCVEQIGTWCEEHGILFTGHMMEECSLVSQTATLGEAMRCYREFSLPGIDMLCDHHEYTTAKQAQSCVRQYGREGMACEMYGVTNWYFDFRGHKHQGDWLAAMGVTARIHHLSWASMEGEAKRDYPASINYQSPWYGEYALVEDYFARLNTVLTRGVPLVKVGVIHPIESAWMCWGPEDTSGALLKELQMQFEQVTNWLLFGLIDFDFISEALLPKLCPREEIRRDGFPVGEMRYQAIVVPGCMTIRKSTMERLAQFRALGGKVLFTGRMPELLDGRKAEGLRMSEEKRGNLGKEEAGMFLQNSEYELLEALWDCRTLDIRKEDGSRTDQYLYQMRKDGQRQWLFLARGKKPAYMDVPNGERLSIRIRGEWHVTEYCAADGTKRQIPGVIKNGWTVLKVTLYETDSLLLGLDEANEKCGKTGLRTECGSARRTGKSEQSVGDIKENMDALEEIGRLPALSEICLEEKNVLLLDKAEYRLDEAEWEGEEEILRLDNVLRSRLGLPLRMDDYAQPWIYQEEPCTHHVSLRITIKSETELDDVFLGMEGSHEAQIFWNGEAVKNRPAGWYVDPCISVIFLGRLRKGENVLEFTVPFGIRINLENVFLLGNFCVKVRGSICTVIAPEKKIGYGSITGQGFPFYGGNFTYETEFEGTGEPLWIQIPKYRGALLKVSVDGEEKGYIAYSPYLLYLGRLDCRKHRITIKCYGNRYNTFGMLHNADPGLTWFGPDAWRSSGPAWCMEYRLKESGILSSPILYRFDDKK